MKKGENIEDWYMDELSNFEVNPEANGWESIANQLDSNAPLTDENIEQWYVKELKKYELAPDKAVWSRLSTKLDVTSVWDKLLVSLNRYERMIWWRNTAFKTIAIVLLMTGGYYTYTNIDTESISEQPLPNYFITENKHHEIKGKTRNKDNTVVAESSNILINAKLKEAKSTDKNKGRVLSGISKPPKLTTVVGRNSLDRTNTSLSDTETALASATKNIGKIKSLTVGNLSATNKAQLLVGNDASKISLTTKTLEAKEFLVKKRQNKIIFNSKRFSSHFVFGMYARRLYFGLNAGAKYQVMFTSEKQREVLSAFAKKQIMDFGGSFGATVGMIVSDKFNLEANVNLLSTNGCKHEYSAGENSFIEEINLEYSTVSILAKKMNNKSTFDNKKYSTNYIGGLYAGFLNVAESNSDGNVSDIKNQFSNIDVGVVLGIEQDRYITKELVITPGIRFNQSLLNTSEPSNEMISSSRNLSVEFNIGLKYIFLKKN